MRILIFGDSITYGEFDTEGNGWAERIKKIYFERYVAAPDADVPLVFNLGVPGDVTRRLTERLPHEVTARRSFWSGKSDFAFVFAIGINDSLSRNGEDFSSVEEYRRDLKALYEAAKIFTDKMLFVGLTPVEDDNPRANHLYSTARIKEFDHELQVFCTENKLAYIGLCDVLLEPMHQGKKLFTDGLHPNSAGHELMVHHILPAIDALTKETK